MQTPFEEARSANCEVRGTEWAARSSRPQRSVFGNYTAAAPKSATNKTNESDAERLRTTEQPLQAAIDVAMARAFVYRFLAQAYQDPKCKDWDRMAEASFHEMLDSAVRTLTATASPLSEAAVTLRCHLTREQFESFLGAYLAGFGHAARGRCPLNEIEYGDLKADPLFQPHRLADLAAFYRAFGLEVAEDADERHDHICLELEFMCVLAAKEAYALEHQLDSEALSVCREAQKRFLREHLGRWTPAFTRRLARMVGDNPLGALANFTRAFVEAECGRFGLSPGSEDLLLRPVDEAAESMCHSCSANAAPAKF